MPILRNRSDEYHFSRLCFSAEQIKHLVEENPISDHTSEQCLKPRDLKFSRRWSYKCWSFALWRRLAMLEDTNVYRRYGETLCLNLQAVRSFKTVYQHLEFFSPVKWCPETALFYVTPFNTAKHNVREKVSYGSFHADTSFDHEIIIPWMDVFHCETAFQ